MNPWELRQILVHKVNISKRLLVIPQMLIPSFKKNVNQANLTL